MSVCEAGCGICAEARGRFDALRAESLVQRRRFEQIGRYPYAAGRHTLHRTGCRAVSVGDVESDAGPWLHGALTRFAHDGSTSSGWTTHMRVMTRCEAEAWVTERIGPRGGLRYRLCGICTPELPVAD
ncbi:hypothetical protein D9753_34720 [Streptomyces dangxiongensis]|uniref:Uncharacterized protein n=1 Tax=Streptomyces dangxiongensis TaxID=1442032 RepID=A0A3G2JQF2_9ACTN|nr:hypothetical protein D9753_34720 [Streptomyces dangxiongensis]